MKKILLVEDDILVSKSLSRILADAGYQVECAGDCKSAWEKAGFEHQSHVSEMKSGNYQLFILDIWLPDGDGIDLCRELRKVTLAPILFLTACEDEKYVVEGLRAGGDDYVIKPFRAGELLARMEALLRRSGQGENDAMANQQNSDGRLQESSSVRAGAMILWPESGEAFFGDKKLELTQNEYHVLELLVRKRGRLVSRDQLLHLIWDSEGAYVEDNTLSVTVSRLRGKLERIGCPTAIETCWGSGYRWIL